MRIGARKDMIMANIDKSKLIDLTLLTEYDKLVAKEAEVIRDAIINLQYNQVDLIKSESANFAIEQVTDYIQNEQNLLKPISSNTALASNSLAFGENTVAGLKGYYFKYIDFSNRKIYLTASNGSENNTINYSDTVPTEIENIIPLWHYNDRFSLISGNHFILCGIIESIEPGVITYTSDELIWNGEKLTKEKFNEVRQKKIADLDDYSISVPSRPLQGDKILSYVSYTEGGSTISASWGHAEGYGSQAIGQNSHAEGSWTIAGYKAHSEGDSTEATGQYSHSEGYYSKAIGMGAHAEGNNTRALGKWGHAEGSQTEASGLSSHAEGSFTYSIGQFSHSEGINCTASGYASHAEGNNNTVSGNYSHVEGSTNNVEGQFSHAEGYNCIVTKNFSHAEGTLCKALGSASHAEGNKAEASGDYSHAGNLGTKASALAQTAIGKYNKEITSSNTLFIIGDGASDTNRSNAFEIISKTVSGAKVRSFKLGNTEIMEEQLKKVISLPSEIENALDDIIAIQENLIGGTT